MKKRRTLIVFTIVMAIAIVAGSCKKKPEPIVITPDIEKNHLQRNHIFGTVKTIETTTYYLAARIFAKFGEGTLDILENEPERLAEVKGISENMARNMAIEYQEKKNIRDAMMFLQSYNISNSLAAKIFEK